MFERQSSGFLPFLDPSQPLLNSINLLEILNSVDTQKNFSRALDLLEFSVLEDFGVAHISLLAPLENQLNDGDWVSWHQSSSATEGDEGITLTLKASHRIREIARSGVISKATTNGDNSIFDISENHAKMAETHEIICVPLLFNLEAKGALVILRERTKKFTDTELSLLSGVQSIFSHFYFKHRSDLNPISVLISSSQKSFMEIGFSNIQESIARDLLEGKTDKQIRLSLKLSEDSFENEFRAIAEILFVQSRDEVIEELSALNLK